MTAPQFLITNYFLELESSYNLEELQKKLYTKGVMTKDYKDESLLLFYHKYNTPITNDLARECRSLVVDKETLKIIAYSCENPLENDEGMKYLLANSTNQQVINTCYEGTFLSVFFHKDKWYVSTRRCLNSQESVFSNNVSHFEMFEDVLKKSDYESFSDFTKELDTSKSYYFVLIHHKNKILIDYTSTFGQDYTKLCLTTIRDSEMRELDLETNTFKLKDSGHIFISPQLESIDEFAEANKNCQYNSDLASEGVIVRSFDTSMNKYRLIKLQSANYQFALSTGSPNNKNVFKGLIHLYQHGRLVDYFAQNLNATSRKIVNPLNTYESYDVIGMVDGVFKVCTSELFELFKNLWSLKTGKHQNIDLYEMLPKEYKDILYYIRGLYFKKKALFFSDKEQDFKSSHLKITDIYNYLKTLSTDTFVAFLRMRRLMLNWVKLSTTNKQLCEFATISKLCDKVHLKLTAIFTNKLFPNIMMNDLPPLKFKETNEVINEV